MAIGIPVITTSLPVMKEAFDNILILVPVGDYISLAREIIFLLENKQKRQEIALKSRRKILEFSCEKVVPRLADFIKSLVRKYKVDDR